MQGQIKRRESIITDISPRMRTTRKVDTKLNVYGIHYEPESENLDK